jgi:fibronectin-binding autotransporter adhesin
MITRLFVRRLLTPLLSAAATLAIAGPVSAQNVSNWLGNGGNGNWSTSANWDAPPVAASGGAGGTSTFITMEGTTNTTTNMNLASPFTITQLTQGTTATSGFTINGGTFNFQADADTLTNPAGIINNSNRVMRLNSNLNVNIPITVFMPTNDPNGAEMYWGQGTKNQLSGSGNITTVPDAAPATNLVILSRNNVNYTGNVNITLASAIQLGAPNALFRSTAISMANSTQSLAFAGFTSASGLGSAGFNQQLGNISGSGQFTLGDLGGAAQAATVLSGYNNSNAILGGAASLAGTNTLSHFGKVGTGTTTIRSSNNSFVASFSVREGTLTLETSGVAVGSYSGTAQSFAVIYGGTQFRLNNATATTIAAGRLGDLFDIRLSGGVFRFDGSGTASASNTENVRNLIPYAGLGVVAVNANAAQFARFNFADFDSSTLGRGGQIGFVGPSLGAGTGAGQSGVTFTSTTALNATAIGGILPWSLAQTNYTTNPGAANVTFVPNTFGTSGANGIAPLTTFDGSNVLAPAGASVLPATINSLVLDAGATTVSSANTTVTAAAILARGTSTLDGTGITSANRGYFTATPGGALTITAPVVLTGTTATTSGLSTSGNVNLAAVTMSGTNPTLQVNSGNTTLTGAVTGATTNPIFVVTRGSTLTVPTGLTINTGGGTLRGNGTVVGNVTVAAGGLIGGTSNAGDNTAGQAPGTLTINGDLILQAGANFRFYINSVYGDTGGSTTNGQYTQAKILATTLDLTQANSTTKITVQPWSLDLKNSAGNAPIYDYDNTEEYFWVLGTFSGGITGFSSDKFTVNTAFQNFATNNPLGFGSYEVLQQGNNLVLHFNPVPEPALLGLAALGLVALRRRKA